MFRRILIANRGEIAVRVIRACREMGITSIAVYSQADQNSLHVGLADESICIGPPPPLESYLNIPSIISAAEICDAQAIHPGYGFLSENQKFASICRDCHIGFIGPSPEAIALTGDKAKCREIVKSAGVPVVPGSEGLISDAAEALAVAQQIAREIQPGARKPLRAGHAVEMPYDFVGRLFGLHVAELPNRLPEFSRLVNRPSIKLWVPGERTAVMTALGGAHEGRQVRALGIRG